MLSGESGAGTEHPKEVAIMTVVQRWPMRLPVLGVLAIAAALCAPLPAQAQVYTWRGANSTDFNNTTNWGGASAPTFPSSGTFVLVTGTLPANMPQLTVSTTIGKATPLL
jgi:hypothetical protein